MSTSLEGRVAVITGAAGGMGWAFADALSAVGVAVVIADLDDAAGREAAQKISTNGGTAIFQRTDVSLRKDVRDLIDVTAAKLKRIDILINNAGIQHVSPIQEFDEDKWDHLLAVMLTGPFLTIKYALPLMMAQKRGRVINISSFHGLVASEFKSAYVAAKHGLIGLNKVVALEGAPYNITSVAVCPSYVRTPLVEKQIASQAQSHGIPAAEVIQKIMVAPAAIKRLLEPAEVASLIVYLCSDAAQAITGTAISIDCGWTAR